jgi:ribosomal protein S18 acetylase RimI-like enzyme
MATDAEAVPPVVFRRAEEADVAAIVALLAADPLGAARERPGIPVAESYLAAFREVSSDPNQCLWVGELDGAVIATMQLTFIPGLSNQGARRGQIEAVRVAEPLRSRGIGEAMIALAVAECRARGCRSVQLTTDNSRKGAHRFYARLGFAPSHVGFKLRL